MKKIILLISLIVLLSTFVYSILPPSHSYFDLCPKGQNWVFELDGWDFDFKPDSGTNLGQYPQHSSVSGPIHPIDGKVNGGATFFSPSSAHLHLGTNVAGQGDKEVPVQNNRLSVDVNINPGNPPNVVIEGTGENGVEISGTYPITGSGTEKDPYTFSFMSGEPPEEKFFKIYCK